MNSEEMIKIQNNHNDVIANKRQHLRNVDNLNNEEIRTIKRNIRINEVKDKLLMMNASDYIGCSNNISMMSFFYKIESSIINIIAFDVNYYDNKDEYMSSTTYKINKNNIASISENINNKTINVDTIENGINTFHFECSLESLRSELMLILNSFFMSKNKKKLGVIKL